MELPARQRYVILSTPRSGSSHLVQALEAHPHVACLGEIFNAHGGALRRLGLLSEQMMTKLATEPLVYLEDLSEAWSRRPDAKPVFGFKMMLHHDPRVIDHLVGDSSWRVILLRRENVLAQWSSLQIAKLTGEWSNKGKNKRAATGVAEPTMRIQFDPHVFEMYCKKLDGRYASITRRVAGHALFEVSTETIDARRDEMLAFLGADPKLAEPSPGTGERQNSSTLDERFENRAEVQRYASSHHLQLSA